MRIKRIPISGYATRVTAALSARLLDDGKRQRLETWPYAAKYLPPGASMPIVTPKRSFREPLVFLNLQGKPPPTGPRSLGSSWTMPEAGTG